LSIAISSPNILIIPGIDNSGPAHWQSIWENTLPNVARAQLGMWSQPHRNRWITKMGLAVRAVQKPVILVAHSLGCFAAAWWISREPEIERFNIRGAMLVAPPNVDVPQIDQRLAGFGPAPRVRFPFPTLLVGSENDPHCSFAHAQKLAKKWSARFINAGHFGHINTDSGVGDWPYGQHLLRSLIQSGAFEETAAARHRIDQFRHRQNALRAQTDKGHMQP
jgi:uncharacterized protein